MNNIEWFEKAQHFLPGGVNSPVRAFKAVKGTPKFFTYAKGAHLFDVEGKQYIDYIGSWGPMILGHSHPAIVEAVIQQVQKSLSFGAPSPLEVQLAEKVHTLIPSMEKMRFVNSGTEATMSAIRLARGYTGKDFLIKFNGCYHGHADCLLVNAGSGALTFGTPSSPGVPKETTQHTLSLHYNDVAQLEETFQKHGHNIAAVILEPIAGNMNMVRPTVEFLNVLQTLCKQFGALLIFDEVMTGFRVHLKGAQTLFGITPDLTCFGKIIGGGMPVGAFGGKADIMNHLAPEGPVYQAGTLSGNPVAMSAGLATLTELEKPGVFETVCTQTQKLVKGFQALAKQYNIPLLATHEGGMFGLFFTNAETLPHNLEEVQKCDINRFKEFFAFMLEKGTYLAPSAFEAGFVSYAHTDEDINLTLAAAEQYFKTF